jgi:cell division protein FtsI/penicillin-binding protein 2
VSPPRSETLSRKVRNRGVFIWWLLVIGCALLAGRLAYMQILHYKWYQHSADAIRLKEIKLAAKRGMVLDRNGRPLAQEILSATVTVDPKLIENPEQTAEALSGLLKMPKEKILPLLLRPGKRYSLIARQVDPEIAKSLQNIKMPGVVIREESKRDYPNGRLASQLIGYVDMDGKARQGVEFKCQSTLAGSAGQMVVELDSLQRIIPETCRERVEPLDGKNVVLTIDSEIQQRVEEALSAAYVKYKAKGAMAIVLDPNTGEILAMANLPGFDLNKRSEDLSKHPDAEANRCIVNIYEPGSTFKPITVAAAWQEKKINANTITYCEGRHSFGGLSVKCSLHAPYLGGHGQCTPEKTLRLSCNISTALIAKTIGPEKLYEYIKAFGILDPDLLGLPVEARGWLAKPSTWANSEHRLANVAFGQGVAVTPLGLAVAYGVIANDGVWVQPHIIKKVGSADVPPPTTRKVISPETARAVRNMMISVVDEGTGKLAQVKGYTIAGKTGTAQKIDPETKRFGHSKYLASFIGMVPVEKPRAIVLVMVDEPIGAIYGGTIAAPVFQEISQYLCWYWRLTPDRQDKELVKQAVVH